MAIFRVTFFFENTLWKSGWAETHYLDVADHTAAFGLAAGYGSRRMAMAFTNSFQRGFRVSNVDPPRDSLVNGLTVPGVLDPAVLEQVGPWDAALVRKEQVLHTSSGRIFIHDTPRSVWTGRIFTGGTSPWFTAYNDWRNYLVTNHFAFRAKVPLAITFTYPIIIDTQILRLTEHRVGRPFDALRGRRATA